MSLATVTPLFQPDRDAMAAHVEHLFGGYLDGFHDGLVELAWTQTTPNADGRHPLNQARQFGTDQLDELVDEAVRLNSQPMCNVYIGAALRHPDTAPFGRATDADVWARTADYADLDDEGASRAAKDRYGACPPTMVVATGRHPYPRGQLWWRLAEVTDDIEGGVARLKGIAAALDGDPTVTNPGRVMRLAGSVAWPMKEERKTELTAIVPLKKPGKATYFAEELEAAFPPAAVTKAAPTAPATAVVTTKSNLGFTEEKLTDGRENYMTRTVCAVLIEYMGQNGTEPTPEELFEEAWPQYAAKVDFSRPGRGPDEFMAKCHYALKRFHSGQIKGVGSVEDAVAIYQRKQAARALLPARKAPEPFLPPPPATDGDLILSPSEFLARFKPPEYLIDGMMQRGYLYSFAAKTGAGKTATAMSIGVSIARGKPILNRATMQGGVLFAAGENPDDIRARFLVLCHHLGVDPASLPFYFIDGVIDIEKSLPRIQAEAAKIPNLQLVIVDTAAAYFRGDDGNSNVQQGAFARVLRQLTFLPTRPTVLVPCHPTKNASRDNLLPVGGGAFLNEVDGNLTLWADGEGTATMHWQGKFRGPEFEPMSWKLETKSAPMVRDSKGREMPSVVASPVGEIEHEATIAQTETDENRLMYALSVMPRASVGALAKHLGWVAENGTPHKGKTHRMCRRLAEQKLVAIKRGKYVLTAEGKREIGVQTDD